jgi:hypothetical protein
MKNMLAITTSILMLVGCVGGETYGIGTGSTDTTKGP